MIKTIGVLENKLVKLLTYSPNTSTTDFLTAVTKSLIVDSADVIG
ncbi:MAG: hypothetical protein ACI845_004385, partial [Gammaproteobacteria bacterium]